MDSQKSALNWLLFALLSVAWASAFAFNRLAVNQDNLEAGLPPEIVVTGRLSLAAVLLCVLALLSGEKRPALNDYRVWATMAGIGIVGSIVPFTLIATAQKTIDSSLAALYVAAAPLFVAVLANALFKDDRLTWTKAAGLLVGFIGVAALFGPEAVKYFGSASVTAQLFCILGTFCYALATIMARYGRDMPPFTLAAGFNVIGALASMPLLLWVDFNSLAPAPSSIGAVIGLGLIPTAMASVLYMFLVRRTSATFVSITGYSIPLVSIVLGYLLFQETQRWNALVAFVLILGGVWLARRKPASAKA